MQRDSEVIKNRTQPKFKNNKTRHKIIE